MPFGDNIERHVRQERGERLARERIGRNKHRNGIPSKDAPKRRRDWDWRHWDWTLIAIIVVSVLVIGGFVALVVVRGIERMR